MHRRLFLQQSSFLAAGFVPYTPFRHTKHLIFIVNGGGARKKDYYENDSLCPNIRKIASEVLSLRKTIASESRPITLLSGSCSQDTNGLMTARHIRISSIT